MAAKTDLWYRECFMLNKKLLDKSPEAVNVIGHLKSHLEEFNLKMPLIKSLSNEALTEDHWI